MDSELEDNKQFISNTPRTPLPVHNDLPYSFLYMNSYFLVRKCTDKLSAA